MEPKQKRARHNFITPKLVSILNKCKVNDRNAVHILIATVEAFELDLNDLIINRLSIHRTRE